MNPFAMRFVFSCESHSGTTFCTRLPARLLVVPFLNLPAQCHKPSIMRCFHLWHVEQLVMSATVRKLYFFTKSTPSDCWSTYCFPSKVKGFRLEGGPYR